MKKIIALVLSLCLAAGLFSACGAQPGTADDKRIRIVTTIFPLYDWMREIVGSTDGVELTLLLGNGVDLHAYQPSAGDLVRMAACDLFVYVGGASDNWVGDALANSGNPDREVVKLLDVLGGAVKEEERVEGMEAEPEAESGPEADEHIWLSLHNASALCRYLAEKLGGIDRRNAALYMQNMQAYTEKLNALDAQYKAAADTARTKTLLFADRFPFRYLADDYGLTYYAAFAGCSAETEASFKTVLFLAGKADELGLHSILQLENADGSLAQTVRENTKAKDQKILTLNSLQSVTAQDMDNGTTYLSVMTENLETLRTALQA